MKTITTIQLFLWGSIFTIFTMAQSVRLAFPSQAGSPFVLVGNKGVKQDTLLKSALNEQGQYFGRLSNRSSANEEQWFPAGVYSVIIDSALRVNFIYNPQENIEIQENTAIATSENRLMDSCYRVQSMLTEKYFLCEKGKQLYYGDTDMMASFDDEQTNIQIQQELLLEELTRQSEKYYAARMLRTIHFINHDFGSFRMNPDSAAQQRLRTQVLSEIDLESLYTSGLWHEVINACLVLYNKTGVCHPYFAGDMVTLLDKVKSPEIYTAFADDMTTICGQLSWDEELGQIADYLLKNPSRLKNPTAQVRTVMDLNKVKAGVAAPALEGLKGEWKKQTALVIFYETGCNHCDNQIQQLKQYYAVLRANNVRVITISSDVDKDIYTKNAGTFPWADKLCDYKGFGGKNFTNYVVMSTPTLFAVKEGKITGRYAELAKAFPEVIPK